MTLPNNGKDRFLAIDANAIIHRAFHAYPSTLQTEDGIQVNALYGFTVMLLSALKSFEPKYVLCSFDTHEPTFRHVEYMDYKATRAPTDQSLIDQFPLVEEILKAFNIPVLKKDGFEADDILGTIAKYVSSGKWSGENLELYILSGDRDLLQLVNEKVKVCLPSGSFKNLVAYDREGTYRYLGLYPEQLVDFKAFAGDSSDNIPGVKGVGEKTTLLLLEKFGDFEGIYNNLKEIKPRYAKLLLEGVEQAELSRRLARIEQEVGLDVRLEGCLLRDFDKKKVLEMFKKYSFKSLISRLDEVKDDKKTEQSNQLDIFSSSSEQVEWSKLSEIEEEWMKASRVEVVNIEEEESALGVAKKMVRVVDSLGKQKDHLTKEKSSTRAPKCETSFYNLENTVSQFPELLPFHSYDIGLFAHLINSERRGYSLADLAFDYSDQVLNEKIMPNDLKKVLDTVEEIRQTQIERANEIELYEYTRKSIERVLNVKEDYYLNVLRKVEIPITKILYKMEKKGIEVNIKGLEKLNNQLSKDISALTKEIYDTIGHEFNINSSKQLSDILFKELDLPSNRKGSTKESVLQELKGAHPVIEKVLQYRELNKVYTTYTTPILELASSSKDNSIHTDFKQTGTSSGRFSSSNPNMQNLPLQGQWAEELRRTFVARKNHKLIAMDYSQIELRIMADMSKDSLLIEDFNNNLDIHKSTIARLLNKEIDEVTKKERSVGKTVNFGILFGQTAYGLASMLKIDVEEASGYIQSYFENYKGVEEHIRGMEKEAYKKGYVQTMLGTTRHIKGLRSKNVRMVRAAQREAINMPIQGSEADIMKLAMIKLDELIEGEFEKKAHILLQIHDELIFEVEEGVVDEFVKKAKKTMEEIVSLEVPLVVNSSVGDNMAELM
ncbi:MAG: DNA polymerase I [Candidatus Dojkabacteria bacterium]|nr:DNA polymerase I [Candidatus Dojkabacteria bacterium]